MINTDERSKHDKKPSPEPPKASSKGWLSSLTAMCLRSIKTAARQLIDGMRKSAMSPAHAFWNTNVERGQAGKPDLLVRLSQNVTVGRTILSVILSATPKTDRIVRPTAPSLTDILR